MRVEEIERLLAVFYEGNTTESQEKMLKEYFSAEDVPEHLKEDKRLFCGFHRPTPAEVPTGLEEKLIKMIDRKEEEELRFFQKNKTRKNWRWIGGIAASVLLLLSTGYSIIYLQNNGRQQLQNTFNDPQAAYEILHATLLEVANGLNTGIEEVVEAQQEVKRTNKEIRKDIL